MSKDFKLEKSKNSQSDGIQIDTLLQGVRSYFDYVAEIHVSHLLLSGEITRLDITVHTGEASSGEDYLDIASETNTVIDTGEETPLQLPYTVMATNLGPGHVQGFEGTTVYMAENVIGANARDMETGLSRLRQKLSNVCPTCGEQVEQLSTHYREQRTCTEADF
jgi:hypothetical protein